MNKLESIEMPAVSDAIDKLMEEGHWVAPYEDDLDPPELKDHVANLWYRAYGPPDAIDVVAVEVTGEALTLESMDDTPITPSPRPATSDSIEPLTVIQSLERLIQVTRERKERAEQRTEHVAKLIISAATDYMSFSLETIEEFLPTAVVTNQVIFVVHSTKEETDQRDSLLSSIRKVLANVSGLSGDMPITVDPGSTVLPKDSIVFTMLGEFPHVQLETVTIQMLPDGSWKHIKV